MFRRLSQYARVCFGAGDSKLARYALEYEREFRDFDGASSRAELVDVLSAADVAFCGDYHTLARAQRTIYKLLEDLIPNLRREARPLILGLEMLRAQDSPKAKAFIDGSIDEREFLRSINFEKSWGFDWESYRPFFELAKKERFEIVGINRQSPASGPALKARDRFAAKVIGDLTIRDPKSMVFVVVGDLHLAREHLPGELSGRLAMKGESRHAVIVHQNLDKFFWKLAERGLEHVEVLKIRSDIYCVMSAAPWVKLQSHIRWAEVAAEAEDELLFSESSATEEIGEMAGDIAGFVGLEPPPGGDFEVCDPSNVKALKLTQGVLSFPERSFVRECVRQFESFFIPGRNLIYLSSPSLNQGAACAALYLHARVSGETWRFKDVSSEFYSHAWREALAFIGSKIINPKRICHGPEDLSELVESREGTSAEIARVALSHWKSELDGKGLRIPRRLDMKREFFYYRVAVFLGRRLGYGLYVAALDNGLSRQELKALFETHFSGMKSRSLYMEFAKRLDKGGYREVKRRGKL